MTLDYSSKLGTAEIYVCAVDSFQSSAQHLEWMQLMTEAWVCLLHLSVNLGRMKMIMKEKSINFGIWKLRRKQKRCKQLLRIVRWSLRGGKRAAKDSPENRKYWSLLLKIAKGIISFGRYGTGF